MKLWGLLAAVALLGGSTLLTAGCAAVDRPVRASTPMPASEGREYVDRLRVDTVYRPYPTGGDCVNCFFELPPGAYVAQGWGWASWCYPPWPVCPSPAFLSAPGAYAPTPHCDLARFRRSAFIGTRPH